MPKSLTWDDAEDIGILLSETHPEVDPLTVRFTDLHRYVTELPDFKGDPKEFAIVIPVPVVLQREQIHVGDRALVDHVDAYSAPRLVEYFD